MKYSTKTKASVERLRKILGKLPVKKQEEPDLPNCEDYNWRKPNYFSAEQLEKLNVFSKSLATQITIKLKKYYRQGLETEFDSVAQLFSQDLKSLPDEEKNYCLSFTDEPGDIFGYVLVPQKTAGTWTRQLLGDSHNEGDGNSQLSSLERSLLHDIAAELVYSLTSSVARSSIKPQGCITDDVFVMNFENGLEVCKITFKFKISGSEEQFVFSYLLPCEQITDSVLIQGDKKSKPEPIVFKEMVIENLKHIKIPLTATLCKQSFNLDDILSLEVDDVIMLDKSINDTIDVFAMHKKLFSGTIAKNEGNYAVMISKIKK